LRNQLNRHGKITTKYYHKGRAENRLNRILAHPSCLRLVKCLIVRICKAYQLLSGFQE